MKPKEETKPTEDRSNNQSKATIIFSELINKRKGLIKKLYDGVDNNNLKFEYAGPAKDIRFYEYKDSREHFDAIKDSQIKFSEVKNLQNEFLNKLSDIKIGKKTTKQKETINNIEKKKRLLIFFRDYIEMLSDANYNATQNETNGIWKRN